MEHFTTISPTHSTLQPCIHPAHRVWPFTHARYDEFTRYTTTEKITSYDFCVSVAPAAAAVAAIDT